MQETSQGVAVRRPFISVNPIVRACLTGALLVATAAAQEPIIGPAEALGFDSGLAVTTRTLEQAVREGDPWEQLSWTFTLRPSVLYRQYLDERGGTTFNPRLSSTLQVRFGETPIETVRRAGRLERALRAHDRAGRLEKRDALLAFAELLLAQDAHRLAERELSTLSPDATDLERQSAELNYRIELADLQAARRDAASYGLSGTASYEPLRFAMPAPPRVSELSAYRLQELVLAEAETRYVGAGGAGVLRDFRIGVGYRTGGVQVDLETGLMAGRPGLRLGTIHPGGRARMDVRVSAEIAISDSVRELPHLQENVEIAREDLEYLADELWATWVAAELDAELAGSTLDYEEASLQEAELALLAVTAELAELPADAEDRERTRLETALGRADREAQRFSTRVYRAWMTYVRRHHDALEAAEAAWSIR